MSPVRRWSWQVGTLGGVPLRVHLVTLLLVVAVPGTVALGQGGAAGARAGAIVGLALIAVLGHELGHALCARRRGLEVEHIQLGPLLNAASLQEPTGPRDELLVAAAGPAANFLLAGVFLAIRPLAPGAADLLELGVWINLAMGLGNLLPCFPLDGARILRGALGLRWPWVHATRTVAVLGTAGAAAGLALALSWLPARLVIWAAVGLVAISLLQSSWRQLLYAWARELSLQERESPQPGEWLALDPMTFERKRKKCVSSQRRLHELSLSR